MAETKRKTTTGTTAKKSTTNVSSAKKKSTSKSKGGAKGSHKKQQDNSFIFTEFTVLFTFAVAVLLFLSNFHLCGKVGEWLRGAVLGSFGILGFVLPVALFVGICFWISNRDNPRALAKLAVAFVIFCVLCGIFELIGNGTFDESRKLSEYYLKAASPSAKGLYGGFVGGVFCKLLCPTFGVIGAYLLLFVLVIGGMVFITEKSFVGAVKRGSDKAYIMAKEGHEKRREIHAERKEEKEEQRRYRAQQRVQGVALTTVSAKNDKDMESEDTNEYQRPDPSRAEPYREETEAGPKASGKNSGMKNAADIFVGRIQMPGIYNDQPDEDAKEKESQTIFLKKDTRTLDEMVGEDSGSEAAGASELEPPFDGFRASAAPAEDAVFTDQEDADILTMKEVLSEEDGFLDIDDGIDDEDDGFAKSMVEDGELVITEGTKTVVTASGKVIEVDTELSKKRLENRKDLDSKEDDTAVRPMPLASSGRNFSAGVKGREETASQPAPRPPKPEPPKEYIFPPLDLLTKGTKKNNSNMDMELKDTAIKLQQTLQNFGVGVTVTNISCGPSVTRYELHPEQGVKVSKIVSLADDIKLNLAAADIRIEAPIPGKAAVGIEVPNKENNVVLLRELLETPDFEKFPSSLAFAVGKDIAGQTVVTDIAKMPHLLIAGATGSGKSVCINTLIMSIIFKSKPEDVKLIMIDPKVVELSVYNGIPHLMIPVVTDPKKASGALNWAVAEMTDRYKKFAEYNVRDLKGYNEKISNSEDESKPPRLPQIVIIVDELADLMMVAPGEVEDAICRLAQLARAAGIHLVIATQRPSVNVITGLIKANVPSRIAFSVSSGVDSRTIIDMNGAEKLLGKGDMLFYPSGYQKPKRVQGAFVSDKEVTKVVEFLTAQGMTAEYNSDVEASVNSPASPAAAEDDSRDEYFERSARFIIEKDKASIGMLQRAFKIGFNRAARIMDQLAEAGVVGEEEGTKPRKILMTAEEFDQYMSA